MSLVHVKTHRTWHACNRITRLLHVVAYATGCFQGSFQPPAALVCPGPCQRLFWLFLGRLRPSAWLTCWLFPSNQIRVNSIQYSCDAKFRGPLLVRVSVALLLSGFLIKRSLSHAVHFSYFYAQTRLALYLLSGHTVVHVEFGLCARWKESAGRLWHRVLAKCRPHTDCSSASKPKRSREHGRVQPEEMRNTFTIHNTCHAFARQTFDSDSLNHSANVFHEQRVR